MKIFLIFSLSLEHHAFKKTTLKGLRWGEGVHQATMRDHCPRRCQRYAAATCNVTLPTALVQEHLAEWKALPYSQINPPDGEDAGRGGDSGEREVPPHFHQRRHGPIQRWPQHGNGQTPRCQECGTTTSNKWRYGNTLCNACGCHLVQRDGAIRDRALPPAMSSPS